MPIWSALRCCSARGIEGSPIQAQNITAKQIAVMPTAMNAGNLGELVVATAIMISIFWHPGHYANGINTHERLDSMKKSFSSVGYTAAFSLIGLGLLAFLIASFMAPTLDQDALGSRGLGINGTESSVKLVTATGQGFPGTWKY